MAKSALFFTCLIAILQWANAECDSNEAIEFLRDEWSEIYCKSGHKPEDFVPFLYYRCNATYGNTFDQFKYCLINLHQDSAQQDRVKSLFDDFCDCPDAEAINQCVDATKLSIGSDVDDEITEEEFQTFLVDALSQLDCTKPLSRKARCASHTAVNSLVNSAPAVNDVNSVPMVINNPTPVQNAPAANQVVVTETTVCSSRDGRNLVLDKWSKLYCMGNEFIGKFIYNKYYHCSENYGKNFDDFVDCFKSLNKGDAEGLDSIESDYCDCSSTSEITACSRDTRRFIDTDHDDLISFVEFQAFLKDTLALACEPRGDCNGNDAFVELKDAWTEYCTSLKTFDVRAFLRRSFRGCSKYNYYILAYINDMTIQKMMTCAQARRDEKGANRLGQYEACYDETLQIFDFSNNLIDWQEFRDKMKQHLLTNCSGGRTEWNFWGWLA